MIKTFKVRNFKNFQDECVIDFSAKKDYETNPSFIKMGLINKALLYGVNGSGKSNLGFAIFDITNHLSDKEKALGHYQNYLNANSIEKTAHFTYVFVDEKKREIEYSYTKDENMNLLEETIKIGGVLFFHYDYLSNRVTNKLPGMETIVLSNRGTGVSILKFMRNNTPNIDKDSPIEEIVSFAEQMLWFRSVRANEYMGTINSSEFLSDFIIQNNYLSDFQSFLADCGLCYKLGIREVPGGRVIVIVFDHKELEFFSTISTGTASLTLFYYWHKKCGNSIKFLYLDEFDAFYHYELSKKIMEIVNSNPYFQSIMTTHNTYLMDNAFMRPDCYFILKDGVVKSLPFRTNKTIRLGNSLENMYLSGTFDK
jgi:AAA15 family ATPase/GTPase